MVEWTRPEPPVAWRRAGPPVPRRAPIPEEVLVIESIRLTPRAPLYLAWVGYGALAVLGLAVWVLAVVGAGSFGAYATRADFAGEYVGATLVWDGQASRLYDVPTQEALHEARVQTYGPALLPIFNYPAWNALLLAPLAALPYPAAFLIWVGVNVLAAALSLTFLIGLTGVSGRDRVLFSIAALAFLPFVLTLLLGQLGILILLSLCGALVALRADRGYEAGAWLVLGLAKPQLIALPLLALLVLRCWRPLVTFALGLLALTGASLLLLGNWIPSYLILLRDFVSHQLGGDIPERMENWRGLVYHLLGTDSTALAGGLITALTVAGVGVVVALCWRRPAGGSPEIPFAVAVLLGLLSNPHFYLYDAVIALLPGFILWRAAPQARALRLALALAPGVFVLAQFWHPPLIQIGAWYLVLVLLLVWQAWPTLRSVPAPALPTPSH
jgi:hypothetical protein